MGYFFSPSRPPSLRSRSAFEGAYTLAAATIPWEPSGPSTAVRAGPCVSPRSASEPPASTCLPHRLVRIRFALHRVLDLTDPATLAALDLRPEDLVGDDWQRTQRLGAQARAAGFEGLLVPSAAGPGDNLVIFPDRLDARSRARSAGSPRPFPVLMGP